MRTILVGLGQRGQVHLSYLHKELVATVDIANGKADYREVSAVPLDTYDAAIVVTDESSKFRILEYLARNNKHVLVEKPLILSDEKFKNIINLCRDSNTHIQVAYNHDFEPSFQELYSRLNERHMEIYTIQIEYRNGTAENIRKSSWRDTKFAVVTDLLPHVLSLLYCLGFNLSEINWNHIEPSTFENSGIDSCYLVGEFDNKRVFIFISYLSWKNTFKLEINTSSETLIIDNLQKWEGSLFESHTRKSPTGKPDIEKMFFEKGNSSLLEMWKDFKNNTRNGFTESILAKDIWIAKQLETLYESLC